jgi:hypothetical protein
MNTVMTRGTLCYKLEGHGFDSCLILPGALGPGVYSASNRNEYQKQKKNLGWGEKSSLGKSATICPIVSAPDDG